MMMATEISSLPFNPSWSFETLHDKGKTLLYSPLFWSTIGSKNEEKEEDETKEGETKDDEEGFEICVNLPKNNYNSDHVILLSKKKVTFDYIQVREYERILGDHPDTKMGPPLSLGWNYKEWSRVDLGQYEQLKYQLQSPSRQQRRKQQQQSTKQPQRQFLRPLNHRARQRLLVSNGVTEEEIRLVEEDIQKISQQRLESRMITPRKERWERLQEIFSRSIKAR